MDLISKTRKIVICPYCEGNRKLRIRQRCGDDVMEICEHCQGEGSVWEITTIQHERITNDENLYKQI